MSRNHSQFIITKMLNEIFCSDPKDSCSATLRLSQLFRQSPLSPEEAAVCNELLEACQSSPYIHDGSISYEHRHVIDIRL